MDPKEKFRTLWLQFLKDYADAKEAGGDTLTNFARGSEPIIAKLYALKSEADPALFKDFKNIADMGLAWETGYPATAVRNFSLHKDLAGWDILGSEMVFSLKRDDVKCSTKLKEKIQDDFKKMTGYDFKDDYLGGGDPPTYIKVPAPESQTLKARLIGSTVAEHGFSGEPIPPNLIKKVGTDPLFAAWDDYQKKILKAADSPEAMGAAFCELSLLLPFNYLNEVMNGLSAYLKEWAAMPIKGGPRTTPRTSGSPESSPGGGDGPGGGGGPGGGTPYTGPYADKTMGDLAASTLGTLLSERYDNELLKELSMMKDAKSQALYTLMDEWKTLSTDPTLASDPERHGALLSERQQVVKQFTKMIPYIVKHARERGNLNVDTAMQQAPNGDKIKEGVDEQIRRINVGLTPDGEEIVGQTAPDITQLMDRLDGDKLVDKRKNFNQTYRGLKSEIRNNALVRAVKDIVDTTSISAEERQRRFKELMHGDTIWTPEDLNAANTLFTGLQEDGHASVPPQVPIKPYGKEGRGHEMDVVDVSRKQIEEIDTDLALKDDKGLKQKMKVHHDEENKVDVAEMVDDTSGSITLRVAEEGKQPWYLTYCQAQQKIVIMDRSKSMRLLDFADATDDLKVTCTQLAGHYTQIMNKESPFKENMNLADTFTRLVGAGRIKAPLEIDSGRS